MILVKAAGLFNSRGYFGASISDVMEATGMEKGGIYNHFGSKDALALQAFDYATDVYGQRLRQKVAAADGTINKLLAVLECFQMVVDDPPVPGGCPLLNSAIESDDAHPLLRERVRTSMSKLLTFVEAIITDGVKSKELRKELDVRATASLIVASLEGGIMLSKLYGDKQRIHSIVKLLEEYVFQCAKTKTLKKIKSKNKTKNKNDKRRDKE